MGAFASTLVVAGCGFTPAFGPNAPVGGLANAVLVQAPVDRVEFELVRNLEHRLGRPRDQIFTLKFDLNLETKSVVVSSAQELNRFSIIGQVGYSLLDVNGEIVARGTAKSFTSYSATGSTLATDASERDAENRLMVVLADQVVTRLIADLSQ